jgi:alkylation response protein AidB-like acyl-CoA dehydrogenase
VAPDLLLNEEELMLKNMVREFAEKELKPRAAEIDETEHFSWENWRAISKLGINAMSLDRNYGGTGGTTKAIAVVIEELARVCASSSVTYLAHVSLAGQFINLFGDDKQKSRWIPGFASGEKLGAFCLTEPGNGSDAAAASTIASKKGSGYVLNGSKTFITNGQNADVYVVMANTNKELRHRGFVALVLEKGVKGLSAQKIPGKMGLRGSDTATLFFDNVEVPEENRLGPEGQGFRECMQVLDQSRISIAAQAVGIAQGAYDSAIAYAKQRNAFGHPIADFQIIQHYLADMAMRIEAARLLTFKAAALRDMNQPFVKYASFAKAYASEAATFVCDRAVQIYGGYGYIKPTDVERFYRDARVTMIYEGTSEIQRNVIARQLFQEAV